MKSVWLKQHSEQNPHDEPFQANLLYSEDGRDGEDTSGKWTLFLADLDYGAQGQLTSWGMVITTTPEPGTWQLLGAGLTGMLAFGAWKTPAQVSLHLFFDFFFRTFVFKLPFERFVICSGSARGICGQRL